MDDLSLSSKERGMSRTVGGKMKDEDTRTDEICGVYTLVRHQQEDTDRTKRIELQESQVRTTVNTVLKEEKKSNLL